MTRKAHPCKPGNLDSAYAKSVVRRPRRSTLSLAQEPAKDYFVGLWCGNPDGGSYGLQALIADAEE